jgi:ABC-type sugar transport system substrate-binding protein
MMPKKKGIPYFNAAQKGAEEAAKELGDVELTFDGPIEDKSEDQSSMLDTWIVRKFNAVAVACNDPEQIAPTLARARDEGLTAITYDSDADPTASKRQFFVNQVDEEELAKTLVDEMAKQVGEDAKVAVVSSSPTAPNQVAWLKAMDAYRAEKYPKMSKIGEIIEYAGENQTTAETKTQSILKAYPDVKGVWGMTSVAFPGAASAVKKAGKGGQVSVVGLATPNDMKPFVKEGVVKSVILWNVVDLGYLTVQVARAVAKGELKEGATTFKAGRLGEVKVKGAAVMLGKPMVFDASNIDQFDY